MNYPKSNQYFVNAITKLSNTFIQQLTLLQKLQGQHQQKVVVEHLHINEGGQAIVGQVNSTQRGLSMKSKNNPMQANNMTRYPFMQSRRCGAKTRQETACKSPSIRDSLRCRMHGGKSSGAPRGNINAITHGQTTAKVKALKQEVRQALRVKCRELSYKPS